MSFVTSSNFATGDQFNPSCSASSSIPDPVNSVEEEDVRALEVDMLGVERRFLASSWL
jgi:hypothetical protein